MLGQLHQAGVVADERLRQRRGHQLGTGKHRHTGNRQHRNALAEQVLQFIVVFSTIMVADDGRTALGIADEHRCKDKAHVHQHAVGRHAVGADELHQLQVVQRTDQRGRQVGHQLAGTVGAGLAQRFGAELGPYKVQQAGVFAVEKVEHRADAAHHLADDGSRRRANDAAAQHTHQQKVQYDVGQARQHSEGQAQLRLFGGDEKALEKELHHKGCLEQQQDAAVHQAVRQQFRRSAQQLGGRLQQEPANDGGDNAHHDRGGSQHREQVVRLLFIASAQCHGDQRAAAGAYHEAQAAKRLQERVDQVQSRKCRFTGKIRDKKAIHHAVHRGEDHHDNGRCHKTQQAAGGKMVR